MYYFSITILTFELFMGSITKKNLEDLYLKEKLSLQDIANRYYCSLNKIQYWMKKHGITTRSISEAVYLKNNPNGDPFHFNVPRTRHQIRLYGAGLGIYWGEGTKANLTSVRLGNSDPQLILTFIKFLEEIFGIDRKRLRFGLQIFSDMSEGDGLDFWQKTIKIEKSQFYKTIITPYHSIGNYRKKSQYGVMTVYFNNKKLRDLLVNRLEIEFQYLPK